MATKKVRYPKQIFISIEHDGDDSYLLAHKDIKSAAYALDFENGEVAVYQLVRLGKIDTHIELI